jgi:hypothetical protein
MFVIRVRNGCAEYVTVTRGGSDGANIEIFGPLAANDQIVRRATDEIREGAPITARPAEAK